MATLSVTTLSPSGTADPAPVAAAVGGDQFTNNGKTLFKVVNGGGSAITVTIVAQRACDQGTLHDITNSVGAGATEWMGPFSERYVDSSGFTQVTYSGVTSVTVAPISLS